jgi:para-nitrobenzyl esterase
VSRFFYCVVLILVAMQGAAFAQTSSSSVRTDKGRVSGVTDKNGVMAYLGIPFAAPPTGNLRWKPPQPAAKWAGVKKADHFGASCVQAQTGSRLPWSEEFMTQGGLSEDCLFLNLWSPAKSAQGKLPVMVWIYGGAFTEGAGAVAVYDGAALARKGVIVVNMNYRVGPLGFLVHPGLTKESSHHSSGNYGLLDQIAALHWVQKNIGAFGGDPAQITIFGQSAGAVSVDDLMRSPLAQGLFVRAIAQSGPGLFPRGFLGGTTLADREQDGVKYAEARGARSLAELRAIPAADFFKPLPGQTVGPLRGPVIDDWVLPKDLPEHQVPLVVGMVSGDIAFLGGSGPPQPASPTVVGYEYDAQKTFGDLAPAFMKLYPVKADGEVQAQKKASQIDRARVSIDVWASNQVKRSGTIYTYYFDRPIPWPAHPEFGAFHSSELPYVFETLEAFDRPWEPMDFKLSDVMSSYWSNFAKTGDPNGPGLPQWPAYTPDSHTTMELGEHVGAIPAAEAAKLDFFLEYLRTTRGF